MATKAHQFLSDLLAQRMHIDGYEVVSFEGYSEIENNLKKLPPTIIRHRPDLLGLKKDFLAIGEAKTAGDIGTRTIEQIEDYIYSSNKITNTKIKIYIAVPLSVEEKVKEIVGHKGGHDCVIVLSVPDRLLPTEL